MEFGSSVVTGSLGDGSGKWHIQVASDQDIKVQSLLDTSTGFLTNLSRTAEGAQNAAGFFSTNVSGPVIQAVCINCHVEGGLAASSALQYTPSDTDAYQDSNFQVLNDYVAADSSNANNLLDKPRGVNHGGGVQLASDSSEYMDLVQFLQLLNADIDESSNNTIAAFWDGVVMASPQETLRRAALIVAQRLPTESELASVSSEDNVPYAIRGLMDGDGFHDFLTTGANDRLFTDAFFGNLNFDASDLNASVFFPIGATRYYEDVAETDEEEQAKFQWNLRWRWGLARAPLELIAYIVMNDRSYQEVLTADYMMLNYMTGDILNSEVEFDTEDPQVFLPGLNLGQIVRDDQLVAEFENNRGLNITSHGDFIDYPHAGVLNTHAFLNRYPSTETNRNRARARWTYYHFLGVDIEKTAERTTDPEALADTDNPTMNNPSCTVCHSLHDPVGGTFQNYGNEGFFRDQRGGIDSLPDTYKHPEWFIDDAEPSDYAEGDTWFRDMREPGFEGQLAPSADNSLAWLGSVIADDPRFATAAVKFWWPALMGTEALTPPEASEDNDFEHKLAAFEAQNAFITTLGEDFENGINEGNPYNAKDLLTEMVMSPWFRAAALTDAATGTTTVSTAYGTDRLLTPLELERKSRNLLGWTWGAGDSIWQFDGVWTNLMDRFRIYYGGINSDGIKERSRALTPLMANVAERQAISMACPAVVIDFDRANSARLLFSDIDPSATPVLEASQSFDVSADNLDDVETFTLTSNLDAVPVTVNISFTNDYSDDESDRNLHLDSLTIRDNQGAEVMSLELEDLDSIDGASAECGNARNNDFVLWSNCSMTIPFTPETAGNYDIEVNAFGDLAGPDLPIMEIQIDSEDPESGNTVGASLIKEKLIDLHQRMLGETLTAESPELEASYQLLVATWQDRITQDNNDWAWSWEDERCQFYLEEQWAEDGVANRAQDPSGMLNTWTSVLIYLMTDFHYLHE